METKDSKHKDDLFEESFSKLSETQQKILRAAQAEFGELGLQGARMQRIADRAGLNKALLHYYFRSKEALYALTIKSIAVQVWGSFAEQMQDRPADINAREIIKTLVSVFINTLKNHQYLPRIMVRELTEGGTIALPILQNIIKNVVATPQGFAGMLMKEMDRGRIKKIELPHIMINILGMCISTFIFKPALQAIAPELGVTIEYDDKFFQARITAITETICDGIIVKENP
jgi:TetR/AcrR family transcriptional regulator